MDVTCLRVWMGLLVWLFWLNSHGFVVQRHIGNLASIKLWLLVVIGKSMLSKLVEVGQIGKVIARCVGTSISYVSNKVQALLWMLCCLSSLSRPLLSCRSLWSLILQDLCCSTDKSPLHVGYLMYAMIHDVQRQKNSRCYDRLHIMMVDAWEKSKLYGVVWIDCLMATKLCECVVSRLCAAVILRLANGKNTHP